MAAGLRQLSNKEEEVMECTDSGEERKQSAVCQPIGLKPLQHFIPQGNSKWAAQGYKCSTSVSEVRNPTPVLQRLLELFQPESKLTDH